MNTMTMTKEKRVQMDVRYCMTPDLPYLRYQGPTFKVFLYDDMMDISSAYHTLQLSSTDSIRKDSQCAVTVDAYSAFHNTIIDHRSYDSYMFDENVNMSLVKTDGQMEPGTVKGSLVEVSLGTLCAYDYYYDNGYLFKRKKIEVLRSPESTQVETVFAYFASPTATFVIADGDEEWYETIDNVELSPFLLDSSDRYYTR